MEKHGLVLRTAYHEVPPIVKYSLTELGQSLNPILDSMQEWGEGYKAKAPLSRKKPSKTDQFVSADKSEISIKR